MSEQVMYSGKIKKVDLSYIDAELYMEDILKEKNLWGGYQDEKNRYPNLAFSIEDYFLEEFYEKYVMIEDELYEIIISKSYDTEDIFEATDNGDGTYDFVVSFYNGGCSFNEAIEQAMKRV